MSENILAHMLHIGDVQSGTPPLDIETSSFAEWRLELANHIDCYVCDDQYLCKKFDQINFRFCSLKEAEEIVRDNLFCLLRYGSDQYNRKYIPNITDDVERRIQDIVRNFTSNLKTVLLKTTLRETDSTNAIKLQMLKVGEIAFNNGIYDFKTGEWIQEIKPKIIPEINSVKYEYYSTSKEHVKENRIITWYFNFNFYDRHCEPNEKNLRQVLINKCFYEGNTELEASGFVPFKTTKDIVKFGKWFEGLFGDKNYCFELLYNMAHNIRDDFDQRKLTHLCEVIGYLINNDPVQAFVMFIGSGANGKNSLIDGCFTKRIFPRPINNPIDFIENNQFVTGSLENRYHNIYLETSSEEDTYKDSTVLKELTGGTDHTIEKKGENNYPGYINCKFLFSANDQDKVKFRDDTEGFRRRINMLELYYHWDKKNEYLTKGDYFKTNFGYNLEEIIGDITNTIFFIYCGVLGLKESTKDFRSTHFEFTENDWKESYVDTDFDLKDEVLETTVENIYKFMTKPYQDEDCKVLFYDENRERLYNSSTIKEFGFSGYQGLLEILSKPDNYMDFFANNHVYLSLKLLRVMLNYKESNTVFVSNFKKSFGIKNLTYLANNRPYVKVDLSSGKINVLREV